MYGGRFRGNPIKRTRIGGSEREGGRERTPEKESPKVRSAQERPQGLRDEDEPRDERDVEVRRRGGGTEREKGARQFLEPGLIGISGRCVDQDW